MQRFGVSTPSVANPYGNSQPQKTVVAPALATIANQPHMLAYINEDERRLLKDLGGADIPGPAGIRAFPPAGAGGGGTKGGQTGSSSSKGASKGAGTPGGGGGTGGPGNVGGGGAAANKPSPSAGGSSGGSAANKPSPAANKPSPAANKPSPAAGGSSGGSAAAQAAAAAKAAADKAAADKAAAAKAAAERAVQEKIAAAERAAAAEKAAAERAAAERAMRAQIAAAERAAVISGGGGSTSLAGAGGELPSMVSIATPAGIQMVSPTSSAAQIAAANPNLSITSAPAMAAVQPVAASPSAPAAPVRSEDMPAERKGILGGYISLADMFDGGGPGKSGPTFEGALSGISNTLGMKPSDGTPGGALQASMGNDRDGPDRAVSPLTPVEPEEPVVPAEEVLPVMPAYVPPTPFLMPNAPTYDQAQFSAIRANVPSFTTFSPGQNAAVVPPASMDLQEALARYGITGTQSFAQGGAVKGYRRGGPPEATYGGAGDDVMMGGSEEDTLPPVAEDPQDPLMAMYERYAQKPVDYSGQIAAATERRDAEQKAFEKLLLGQLDAQDSAPQSKAEMYFRLAAAFGAPTQTGNFSENLALVGSTVADQLSEKAKREREARDARLGVQTELQKMRMEAAGGELETLRGLQEGETQYGREMAKDMLDKYITSGKPQSEAGKIAVDMGLKPGTPEYNEKVAEITELKIQREMAAIEASLASTQATIDRGNQLSSTEIKLRAETEDRLAGVERALNDVAEAYRLNPNSYAGSWLDRGARFLYEGAGSDDPKIVNTRRIDNLLGSQALESLKAVFGGAPTEGERAILLDLQGIGAKSLEERAEIMLRAYEVLQDRQARDTKRLEDILSGSYRNAQPIDGE
jgi:hypothetical protein